MDLPKNTIVVQQGEELVSVLEQIHGSSYDEIFLVVPRGVAVGQGAVDLKVLKREAEEHDKVLRIVAQDPGLHKLARSMDVAWEGNAERFWERIGDITMATPSPGGKAPTMSDITPEKQGSSMSGVADQPTAPEREEPPPEPAPEPEPELEPEPEPTPAPSEEVPSEPAPDHLSSQHHPSHGDNQGEAVERIARLYRDHDDGDTRGAKHAHGPQQQDSGRRQQSGLSWWVLTGFGVAAVALFVVVASVVLPKADVVVSPRTETASVELAVLVDANRSSVGLDSGSIPGQVLEVQRSAERSFPATGSQEVAERATGTITVYNEFSSEPQTLVRTTRFLADSGELFRLTETVTVPGARIVDGQIVPSSIEVPVAADEPGEAHNIGPSRFTIPGFQGTPKYDGFYGESTEPMTGGVVGTVTVATPEDIDGAVQVVEEELRGQLTRELENQIPDDLTLHENARGVDILERRVSTEANVPLGGKQFTVSVEAVARAMVFREEDATSVVQERIGATLSENKVQRDDTLSLFFTPRDVDFEAGIMEMTVRAEETIAWNVDQDALRERLQGKDESGVRGVLSDYPEVASVEVTFWPFWVSRVPDDVDRIDVVVR